MGTATAGAAVTPARSSHFDVGAGLAGFSRERRSSSLAERRRRIHPIDERRAERRVHVRHPEPARSPPAASAAARSSAPSPSPASSRERRGTPPGSPGTAATVAGCSTNTCTSDCTASGIAQRRARARTSTSAHRSGRSPGRTHADARRERGGPARADPQVVERAPVDRRARASSTTIPPTAEQQGLHAAARAAPETTNASRRAQDRHHVQRHRQRRRHAHRRRRELEGAHIPDRERIVHQQHAQTRREQDQQHARSPGASSARGDGGLRSPRSNGAAGPCRRHGAPPLMPSPDRPNSVCAEPPHVRRELKQRQQSRGSSTT
jgi:hypothetical protein